jgi:phospholipase/carboxylesterase
VKYPLVVGLHGYGSNPDRFITLWERFAGHDFIYAVPRAPYPFLVGKWIGYSWAKGIPGHRLMSERATTMTERYIAGVVKNLCNQYSVSDVYLLGFSQGCAFTYQAGIKNHELFDGLICFGGWLDTDWISEEAISAANSLRIFIAHGTEDRMVEYESGIKARDCLEEHGYDVTFHEFDGAHSVPEEALQAAETWMKE